jgi:uncharacterized protein YjbI with pentapeptide repeats
VCSSDLTFVPIWQFVSQLTLLRWDEERAARWIPKRVDREKEPSLTLTTLRAAAAYWLLKKGARPARTYPLAGIMLDSVDLQDADFYQCDLSGADFHESDLRRANFSSANLTGGAFQLSNLDESTLAHAEAVGADFMQASFSGADLSDANLRRARLDYASFTGARLSGGQLEGASIYGADFRGASLGEAESEAWRHSLGQLNRCAGVGTALFDEIVAANLRRTLRRVDRRRVRRHRRGRRTSPGRRRAVAVRGARPAPIT